MVNQAMKSVIANIEIWNSTGLGYAAKLDHGQLDLG
jgi:hypothetical protein